MQCLYCSVCHYMQPSVIIHKLVKLLTGDECTVSDCVLIEKLRASLCKILISSFAHKMDFTHNVSVDFF